MAAVNSENSTTGVSPQFLVSFLLFMEYLFAFDVYVYQTANRGPVGQSLFRVKPSPRPAQADSHSGLRFFLFDLFCPSLYTSLAFQRHNFFFLLYLYIVLAFLGWKGGGMPS